MEDEAQSVKNPPTAGLSADRAQLLAELQAIEANPNPFNSLTLFFATLVLFFAAGIVRYDLNEIGILIGVLLFHELGHLAAMKALGYKDVKIFFVPFLGAAATGKTGNLSAVRSCFVSIMGPLPGVVASLGCIVLFSLTNSYYALKTAQIMLLLNVFNMLPIMPLDGGRFVDVLFVRNRYFRFAFALFGVGCFAALAISGADFFIGLIAVFSLIGAIAAFRYNRLAQNLIASGMREKSLAELAANPDRFDRLVSDLQIAFPKSFHPQANPKSIHGHIAGIIETVKFVPAKWPMKILLSGAYAVILLASLAFAVFFLVADYHEKLKPTGDASLIGERYYNRRISGDMPLDKGLFYHGTGRVFGNDTTQVLGTIQYTHGYRNGLDIDLDAAGDTARIAYYTMGRLDSIVTWGGAERKRVLPAELPWIKRVSAWAIAQSQPRKSNHKLYDR